MKRIETPRGDLICKPAAQFAFDLAYICLLAERSFMNRSRKFTGAVLGPDHFSSTAMSTAGLPGCWSSSRYNLDQEQEQRGAR